MNEAITVFVTHGCARCHAFTDELVKADIIFKPRVVDEDEEAIADLVNAGGNVADFPMVLLEGELYSPEAFWAKQKEKGDEKPE